MIEQDIMIEALYVLDLLKLLMMLSIPETVNEIRSTV